MAARGAWMGRVEGLLTDLTAIAGTTAISKDWPANPCTL
jgi:hypothetical protein